MSELIPTGKTFGHGRKRINAFFSANTYQELLQSGITLNVLYVSGNISGGTFYSGSTELSKLFSSGEEYVETTSAYTLSRKISGDLITSKLTVTGFTDQFSVDLVPQGAADFYKFQEYIQLVKEDKVGGGNPGEIQFNQLDVSGVTETFSISAAAEGYSQRLDDTYLSSLTYVSDRMPALHTSGITLTHYPATTPESGITRTFFLRGYLI